MKAKITIDQINQAFTPAQEIIDPERFLGRYEEIKKCILSLSAPGSFIAIYGLRGLGKSSMAHQVKNIATGDHILAKRLGLSHYLPKKDFNYIVKLVQCDEFCSDITLLLKRIIFGDDKNSSLFSHTKLEGRTLEKMKEKVSASIQGSIKAMFAKIRAKGGLSVEKTYTVKETDDLIQSFKQILGTIRNDNQNRTGILILLDEFDIIKHKEGFASIIKTCSSDFVKFGIVGIGENISELLDNHSSVGRQIDEVNIQVMSTEDLRKIIDNAEEKLKNQMIFESEIKLKLCNDAEGFAYFVHLLGKCCLMYAFEQGKATVNGYIYDKIYKDFIEGRLVLLYETIYVNAVRTSPETETLLKLFSESKEQHILTENIYELAREFGLKVPGNYLSVLTQAVPGKSPILIKVNNTRVYRFTDPIFKVFAKKRKLFHSK